MLFCKIIKHDHFKAGDILRVGRFEDNQYFCTIEVLSVSPITIIYGCSTLLLLLFDAEQAVNKENKK